ncbi:MAG TPA: hypothetical protein VJU85_05870 [Nitrososphaeraceae archaeon]|nr:hypothetical protein [Nitrososphaeraceae archaeon]
MANSPDHFNHYLQSSHSCKKFLIKDGITSPYFEIEANPGFFNKTTYDIISLKNTFQNIGECMSIIKNFDYYQYLICKMLPEIADTNPFKKVFQKIRFVIICSFAKFISLLDIKDYETITKWNLLSKKNLESLAEIVNSYRQGIEFSYISNGFKLDEEICIFFNLNIEKIDEELNRYYL